MKTLLINYLLFATAALCAQNISINPSNVVFINNTSAVICNNADSIAIDLDSDSIMDIKIRRNNFNASCYSSTYRNLQLSFVNYDSARVLSRQNWDVYQTVAEEFSINQSINPNNYWTDNFGYFFFYWKYQSSPTNCTTFYDGNRAPAPTRHRFLVSKPDSGVMNYYLFALEYTNNSDCYQIVKPGIVGLGKENSKADEYSAFIRNGQLNIELSLSTPLRSRYQLFDLKGRLLMDFTSSRKILRKDINGFRDGMYILKILDFEGQTVGSQKLIK